MAKTTATPAARPARAGARRPINVPAPAAPVPEDFAEYPTVKYRKVPESKQYPNGYQAKRFYTEEEAAAAGKAWVDSPADL